MTQSEYYESPSFLITRLLNNKVHGLTQTTQQIADILLLVESIHPGVFLGDRFSVVERQLRIVHLEAQRLIRETSLLEERLRPKTFSEPSTKIGTDNGSLH